MIPSADANASIPPPSALWWQWKQGAFLPVKGVPLSDRGFRYGMHLFESTRFQSGQALLLGAHLVEMHIRASSMGFLGTLPTLQEVLDWLRLEGLPDGIFRFYWTAGDGAPGQKPTEGRIFFTWEAKPLLQEPAYEKGFSVLCSLGFSAGNPSLNGMKTGNYWNAILALHAAKERFLDETLFLDPEGNLSTFATGNLLVYLHGEWLTPLAETGFRTGTVRAWCLQKGITREAPLPIDWEARDLELAHVNSFHGVMPIAKVIMPGNPSGKVLSLENAMTLHHYFEREVRGEG